MVDHLSEYLLEIIPQNSPFSLFQIWFLRIKLLHSPVTIIADIDLPLLCVDEAQCVEADQMLRCILEFEEQCVKPRPDQSAMSAHSLAMLWLLCNNYTKVNNKDQLIKVFHSDTSRDTFIVCS